MKKSLLCSFRNSTNSAITVALHTLENTVVTSPIHLKIHSLNKRIKDSKTEIGDYVYNHPQNFEDIHCFSGFFVKIKKLEDKILFHRQKFVKNTPIK